MLAALLCNLPTAKTEPVIGGGILPWMLRRPETEDELQEIVERVEEAPNQALSAELENVLSRYRGANALERVKAGQAVHVERAHQSATLHLDPPMITAVVATAPVINWTALLLDLDRIDYLMRLHRLVLEDETLLLLL